MRTFPLALPLLVTACSRQPAPAAPVPAPLPAPVEAPPPAPPAFRVIGDPILLCVIRGGRMEEVEIEYHVSTSDSTYQGQPIARAFPLDSIYAAKASWYVNAEPLPLLGALYTKYGLPRILGTRDVVPVTTFRGVTVFAEPRTDALRLEVIYLPVRPGCEFQPYERRGNKE